MHILIFNWRDIKNPKSGGAEIVTHRHAKSWVKKGHKVTWFTSNFKGGKKDEIIDGISIIRKGSSLGVYLYAPIFYLFSKKNFDCIVDEVHGIPFFTPLYVRKKKVVFIHEVAGEIWNYMYPWPVSLIGRIIERLSFLLYKHVIFWTDANSTLEELVSYGIPRNNCHAIPCPISNTVIDKLPIKNTNNLRFLFMSRVVKMKGVEEVIKAFGLINNEKPQSKLSIAGKCDESYLRSLKSLISSLGISSKVTFHGKVSEGEKLKLMQNSTLLLHASVKEGWGLVVLEAASQGTPSVVYNVNGLKDIVKHGETGLIVSENSPQNLASSALKLLSDKNLYKKMQKNGLHRVKQFNWSDVTNKSMNLLNSL